MRILVTNDDGIHAPGLKILERIAKKISKDIWTVAPETEQSGAGHSLSLSLPVRIRKISARKFAVDGTPTDCVLMATQAILPPPLRGKGFDLVLSGVNSGSNVGDDVTYSGTIAAAMEGTLLNVPSIALSLNPHDTQPFHWKTAETFAPKLIKQVLKAGWPKNTLININFPACNADKVRGVKVCPQGKRKIGVALSERVDQRGKPYFWIGGERENTPDKPGVDVEMLEKGYITITPLYLDLTDYKTLEKLRNTFT